MIRKEQVPELRTFANAERKLPLHFDSRFAGLVVPNGNMAEPGHRWFKYKEAFSSEFISTILRDLGINSRKLRLLDPFCGVGTSLLSAQLLEREIEAIGIECNPFSAFVAKTKVAWPVINVCNFRVLSARLLRHSRKIPVRLPKLSSITSGRCITRTMAVHIMTMRQRIESLPPSPERDVLLLGLASIIETVSRTRRDGRALRIVEKPRVVFHKVLESRWALMADDIEIFQAGHLRPQTPNVLLGDGREPQRAGVEDNSIDLIITSPPYPNNIDYNEVYKLELWFLGFAKSSEEFLSLRRQTFRSHPTCSPVDFLESDIEGDFVKILNSGVFADLMGAVLRRVAMIEREHRRGRMKVLVGYAYDTWRSLKAHYAVLRSGGHAIYVVGNSLHGGGEKPYLVPTDLIYTTLATLIGFEVKSLVVARGLQRRLAGNHFLRDSVVILRKH